ncbi:MAG: RNA 2',3'-cyclic phosphodiesterase [Gammaproteobacteria bacterium]|nr:RNA 2',3'-cyclic phosphodiesterase [Gammaproteobacteria bacterium]MDD9874423.1 RNA 2',3'-cyclic phosphodiesterase [Gammaproteobacteria bacterium]
MRAFLALDIPPPIQHAIERWRDRQVVAAGRAVPAANFHITLHFLGDITPRQLERLCLDAGRIRAQRFDLVLDQPGYFPRPGIFWLGPGQVPGALTDLAAALRRVGRKAGIAAPRKPFQPHLTLFRNCRARPPLPTGNPDFHLPCDGFTLFQSVTGHKGVRYQPLHRWAAE